MVKLTKEQFLELNTNLIVNEDGTTNKKCPLCGKNVFAEINGTAITIKCESASCFRETMRGI